MRRGYPRSKSFSEGIRAPRLGFAPGTPRAGVRSPLLLVRYHVYPIPPSTAVPGRQPAPIFLATYATVSKGNELGVSSPEQSRNPRPFNYYHSFGVNGMVFPSPGVWAPRKANADLCSVVGNFNVGNAKWAQGPVSAQLGFYLCQPGPRHLAQSTMLINIASKLAAPSTAAPLPAALCQRRRVLIVPWSSGRQWATWVANCGIVFAFDCNPGYLGDLKSFNHSFNKRDFDPIVSRMVFLAACQLQRGSN